eukprot:scaffold437_cov168-Ochromonas_danica.AAC.63
MLRTACAAPQRGHCLVVDCKQTLLPPEPTDTQHRIAMQEEVEGRGVPLLPGEVTSSAAAPSW